MNVKFFFFFFLMEVKLALELKIQTLSFQMIGCAMLCTPCVGGQGLWDPYPATS